MWYECKYPFVYSPYGFVLHSFVITDETQDVAHEEEQTARVREWINSRHINTVDLADILSNFPDISVVIIDSLLLEFNSVVILQIMIGCVNTIFLLYE